ncbi:keratin, type I cytoskeletal 18 isoform X2 [Tachysurus vachellii]|uniref:keratin, type I cytoskeletal 18 isoform X2 n=1 Tax=Tachysurus vachellii TaxID=175792 RepID=UPI00296B4DD2|nr:keratin, type I cytoskeletal 18 isoform X2 [Tachysurus vachellii]
MSRGVRASSVGAEARLGRARSPARFGAGGAMHPGEDKETMRGLNERLAGYLSQVRLLEETNSNLEAQINEVLTERRAAGQRDWSGYEKTLSTLRDQVKEMTLDNARLMLQIDNARLAADDFKVKLEAEVVVRQGVEQDTINLRKMIDDTHMNSMKLESEVESLAEELIYLKKNHEEDLENVKGQIRDSNVDVQMDAVKGQDISETMEKIRKQYEKAAQKSQEETEAWYQNKFESISSEVRRNTDALQQGQCELNDLRRQKQGLEIDLQTMHSMNRSLEDTLNETMGRNSQNINNHNMVIQQLEAELAEVHAQVTRQGAEYQALLNIKSKLEEEIATYHSLLEGTGLPSNGVTDPNPGLPANCDFKGIRARDDVNIKNVGPPEDANVKDNGAFEDPKIEGSGLGGSDESVEFSLEQALCAAPCFIPPEPPVNNEIAEEEVVIQKDLELNAANTAMNKHYAHNEAGQGTEEDPVILGEMEKKDDDDEEEDMVSPLKDPVAEKNEKETMSPVVDIQMEKVLEVVGLVEKTQVEKVEETSSSVQNTQMEKVEETASLKEGTQEEVEETASPVEGTQGEVEEETASPVEDTQGEVEEETASPVEDTQVEKVEETASLKEDTQVEKVEDTSNPVEDTQPEEEVELKPAVENINPEEEKQKGEEPENPEAEPLMKE